MAKKPASDFSAVAPQPVTANKATVQAIFKELNSNLGTPLTGSAPYKLVESVTLIASSYHERKEHPYGRIEIESENGSMHGDKWQSKKRFYLSRADAAELAKVAPEKFRQDFAEIVSALDVLSEKFDTKRAQAKKEEQQRLFMEHAKNFTDGLGADIAAPERASFKKKSPRNSLAQN